MLIGITGPSGAGKGRVVEEFAGRGFAVIDADQIARESVLPGAPALKALAETFGEDIILSDGSLDRRLLAGRAFASVESTKAMNSIMLSGIVSRMTALAGEYADSGRNCLFDAPLLIEAGLDRICDVCVAVVAPLETRIERLIRRDGLSEAEIRSRISRQHSDDYYTSRCDYVIVNDGDIARLRMESQRIADRIMQSADTYGN